MSRNKSKETGRLLPASERHQLRLTAEAEADVRRMEDWFTKTYKEQTESPELQLLLEDLRNFSDFHKIETRQFIQLTAVGVLGLIPLVISVSETEKIVSVPVVIVWIFAMMIASSRFMRTRRDIEEERSGLLDEFSRRGFSPSNVSLDFLPKVWRGIEDHDLIIDSLLSVARDQGFFADEDGADISLDALLEGQGSSNSNLPSQIELDEEGEIRRLTR